MAQHHWLVVPVVHDDVGVLQQGHLLGHGVEHVGAHIK
jgi:hypothetical protein